MSLHRVKRRRAKPNGVRLTETDAATIKGMLSRGDRQSDIASLFGVNPGRISEVGNGSLFSSVVAAPLSSLPEAGALPAARLITALGGMERKLDALLKGTGK